MLTHALYLSIITVLSILLWRQYKHNRRLTAHIAILSRRVEFARSVFAETLERHAWEMAWAEQILKQRQNELERHIVGMTVLHRN
jgi:hypothetical protein